MGEAHNVALPLMMLNSHASHSSESNNTKAMKRRFYISGRIAAGLVLAGAILDSETAIAQQSTGVQQRTNPISGQYPVLKHFDSKYVEFSGSNYDEYRKDSDNYFRRNYPHITNDVFAYTLLLDLVAGDAQRGNGKISSWAFNTSADYYNNYSAIVSAMERTSLDRDFVESLKRYYAQAIFHGSNVDIDKEMGRVKSIPVGSTCVRVSKGAMLNEVVDTYVSSIRNSLDMSLRQEAYNYVYSINPIFRPSRDYYENGLHYEFYKADYDGFIVIPRADLLQSIASPQNRN
jgi:hypothetical protein